MFNIPTNVSPSLSLGEPSQNQNNNQQIPNIENQNNFNNIQNTNNQGVSLKKGQKTNLDSNLTKIRVGLGWDANNTNGIPYDLDSEVFLLGSNDKVIADNWFVFYGNTTSPDGSVCHHGDNRDGNAIGDDEIIDIDLSKISSEVFKLVFVVTIHEAKLRGHNFGQISNTYIRVLNLENNQEILRYNLTDYYPNVFAMVVGEFYRYNGSWKFNPVGDGTADDLEGLCRRYGVNIAN